MAIGLRLKFEGGTQDQYDAMHSQMGIDGDPPEGLIFQEMGDRAFQGPPDIKEFPVHHITKP